MFGFTTSVGGDAADPLVSVAAVDEFWRLLPRYDPVRAQKKVSEAMADFGIGDDPNVERLRALLVLDRRARSLADALLVNYTGQLTPAQSFERRYWQSARELSEGFGRAYAQVLRQLEHDVLPRAARDFAPVFLLRLFQHRQIEFLLQPFESGAPDPGTWSELHEAYQYAHSQRLLNLPQDIRRSHDMATVQTTIEREYLHLLLLDLISVGHFSAYDAFWVNQWIPRGCAALVLTSVGSGRPGKGGVDPFVVDLDSVEGLVRAPAAGALRCLYLDTSPLLGLIEADIQATRNVGGPEGNTTSVGRAGRLKVLKKLRDVYSPKPSRVNRRGERKLAAVIVQAVVGFSDIVRMLRIEQRRASAADASLVPEVEEITITVTGGIVEEPGSNAPKGASRGVSSREKTVSHLMWEIRDRSDSGCRLHGKVPAMSGVVPGTLVAIREHDMAPWILVVVRRRGKAAGDRVDIGVEYVGKEPRRVVAVLADDEPIPAGGPTTDHATTGGKAAEAGRRFPVLFLHESSRQPMLPFKTLLMPPGEFEENRALVLRAGHTRHKVRLKQPLEEQAEFNWLPFEVIDRTVLEPAA